MIVSSRCNKTADRQHAQHDNTVNKASSKNAECRILHDSVRKSALITVGADPARLLLVFVAACRFLALTVREPKLGTSHSLTWC